LTGAAALAALFFLNSPTAVAERHQSSSQALPESRQSQR
jgi:hypothetical protein